MSAELISLGRDAFASLAPFFRHDFCDTLYALEEIRGIMLVQHFQWRHDSGWPFSRVRGCPGEIKGEREGERERKTDGSSLPMPNSTRAMNYFLKVWSWSFVFLFTPPPPPLSRWLSLLGESACAFTIWKFTKHNATAHCWDITDCRWLTRR